MAAEDYHFLRTTTSPTWGFTHLMKISAFQIQTSLLIAFQLEISTCQIQISAFQLEKYLIKLNSGYLHLKYWSLTEIRISVFEMRSLIF